MLRNESYGSVEDSFIHVFICLRLVPRTRAGYKLINCLSDSKRFHFRHAVVQQSRRKNIVAYLLLGSAIQRLAGARSRLYHDRLLVPKHHVSAFFKMYRLRILLRVHCHVPCLCFILLSWPFCLLVFSASFLSFQFLLLLLSGLFSWLFITFLGVSWRCVACLGLPWLFLIFLGFAWRFCSLVFASLLAFLFVLFPGLLILIHDCAKHFARTRARWSTYLFLVSLV